MSQRGRWLAGALVVLAALALLALEAGGGASGRSRVALPGPHDGSTTRTPPEASGMHAPTPLETAPLEAVEVATVPTAGPSTPLPTRASPRPATEVDPCGDPPAITRHDRLDELVNARLAEVRDRARLALSDPRTSPALRAALDAVLVSGSTDLAAVEPALRAPDRVADGFDLAAALELTVAVRLDQARDHGVEIAIERASHAAPTDPAPEVLRALRAMRSGEHRAAREALSEAFRRDRAEPAISIELAYALARTVDHARTLAAVDAYLAVYPGDEEALRLRARTERRREGVGVSATASARGVTVLHPRDLPRAAVVALEDTIADALDESAHLTGLPRREELAVLVHRDHEAMLRAMCGQSWTAAAYDGVLHVERSLLDDDTAARVRVGVLRHETLHASLHDRAREVPYWVDEGIAQYFSGLVDPRIDADLARLVRDRTYVPLASLDGAFLDIDDADDARLAYHQSLAMIEWLVAQRGPRGIAELVARLDDADPSAPRDPATMLGEIAGRRFDGEVLLAFLASR